jgi:hypothetical protein
LYVIGFDEQHLQKIRNPPVVEILQHLQLPAGQRLGAGFCPARNENILT